LVNVPALNVSNETVAEFEVNLIVSLEPSAAPSVILHNAPPFIGAPVVTAAKVIVLGVEAVAIEVVAVVRFATMADVSASFSSLTESYDPDDAVPTPTKTLYVPAASGFICNRRLMLVRESPEVRT